MPYTKHCLPADVSKNVDNEKKVYLGLPETPFKRYSNHVRYSKHEIYSNATELSKYM